MNEKLFELEIMNKNKHYNLGSFPEIEHPKEDGLDYEALFFSGASEDEMARFYQNVLA